jgi:hypothetical protein
VTRRVLTRIFPQRNVTNENADCIATTSVDDWHIHARNASGCYFVIVSANVLQIPVDDNISRNGTEATSNGTPQR